MRVIEFRFRARRKGATSMRDHQTQSIKHKEHQAKDHVDARATWSF
jgi:hypothetical protein